MQLFVSVFFSVPLAQHHWHHMSTEIHLARTEEVVPVLRDNSLRFVSVDNDGTHGMMQAYLQKSQISGARRMASPVPGLMLVIGDMKTASGSHPRLFMIMTNQTPGEVAILPRQDKKKRRAVVFSGVLPSSVVNHSETPLCVVHTADLRVLGPTHRWRSFDAPMRNTNGAPMSKAELRKHSVKLKDGSGKRRPIAIATNSLVTDKCTWFLMSLAGSFMTETEYGSTINDRGDTEPLITEYRLKLLPFTRLQTAVTVLKNHPTSSLSVGDTQLSEPSSPSAPIEAPPSSFCVVSAMFVDVPLDMAIEAFGYGVEQYESPKFCRDMLYCLTADSVGPYVPKNLEHWMVNMQCRQAALEKAQRACATVPDAKEQSTPAAVAENREENADNA